MTENLFTFLNWIQVIYALWSVLRIKPVCRLFWCWTVKTFFGAKTTKFRVHLNSSIASNLTPDEWREFHSPIISKFVDNGWVHIQTKDTLNNIQSYNVSEKLYDQFREIICAGANGSVIISQELTVTPFLKIYRSVDFRVAMNNTPYEKVSVRKNPDNGAAMDFLEKWPLEDNFITRVLPVVPLVLQAKGENSVASIFFFTIFLLDLFACQLTALMDTLTTGLGICLQKYFTNKLKKERRIYSYFLLGLLSRKFVSCNFITNKREELELDGILVHESSFFFGLGKREFRLIVPEVDEGEDQFPVGQQREFEGEGVTVVVEYLSKVAGDQFKFNLILKAGEQEVSRGEYTCKCARLALFVHGLEYGTESLCPLISNNGQGSIKRLHCFDVEFTIDKLLNTDELFYSMSLEPGKYEIYDPSVFKTDPDLSSRPHQIDA